MVDSSSILLPNGRPAPLVPVQSRRIKAGYDAARTTPANQKYWQNASDLSADQEISPSVRRILRNRCRYERGNNPWVSGILDTLANDVIGTGPRLNMESGNETLNDKLERDWQRWSDAVNLAETLHLMRTTRACDGESFAQKITNPALDNEIKLDVRVIECDQVCSPFGEFIFTDNEVDGILFDEFQNPYAYRVMRYHPSDVRMFSGDEYRMIPASAIIHYFRKYRPGQHRGIPEMTSALRLFAMLRQYQDATLKAAITAAMISGVLYTDNPAIEPVDGSDSTFERIDIETGAMLSLPDGWKFGQIDAKQPMANYIDFKRDIQGDAGRGQNVTLGKAIGNHSGYNYASGRLDAQDYFKHIRNDQNVTRLRVIEPIFKDFIREWALYNNVRMKEIPEHSWFFDGTEHVDPQKEASATDIKLKNRSTNLAYEYARRGQDWRKELKKGLDIEQFEMEERKKRGLPQRFEAEQVQILQQQTEKDEE